MDRVVILHTAKDEELAAFIKQINTFYPTFYPSAIKAVGYSDHQRRAGWQSGGRSEIQLLLKS